MSRVAVLAGNVQEFKEFKDSAIRNGSLSEFFFVTRYNYHGYTFNSFTIIGTYWNRKEAHELLKNVKLCLQPFYYDIDDLIHI